MKYIRADEILPHALLNEIQSYVENGLIYIPKAKEKHMRWGEASGEKKRLEARNLEIRHLYKSCGISLNTLSSQFGLSEGTIKNIVYRK
ncbi:MAG: CD3324 family protein [Defluviitaleaceae bacterium]|nr:CD3324 family protein [Defluviitaleaceae bacterium]